MVPKAVKIPQATKIKPTLSDSGLPSMITAAGSGYNAEIRNGQVMLIIRFMDQFKPVAMLIALSCMISAMYSHRIGPEENSKAMMNMIRHASIPSLISTRPKTPTATKSSAMKALNVNISVLRPYLKLNRRPTNVDKKLTRPIMKVILVSVKS